MDSNDLSIVKYIQKYFSKEPVIFDIGANRGEYTDFVLSLMPNATMVLVEPNDMWIKHLSDKYVGKRIQILNMLVGSVSEDIPFYYFTNNNDQLSSIYKRPVFDELPMQEKLTHCTTIDNIMGLITNEVDFVKIDTEGAEFDVLKGAAVSLLSKKINFLQVEYGETYKDAGITMKELILFVNKFGYEVYSFNGAPEKLNAETFVEDFHYDNYIITHLDILGEEVWGNTYASFVNLDHRKDRLEHMTMELDRVGIKAVRTRGMPVAETPNEDKYMVMRLRTPGAIGCHLSQVKIMQEALERDKNAFVMEDDLIFCNDLKERLDYIEKFTKTHDWDVIFLGATFQLNPPYWHSGTNKDLPLENPLKRDAECTDDPRMIRTYGCFSTYAYIVNKDSISKILQYFDANVHLSMGIDWLFIKMSPQLNAFTFVPGSVIQMNNPSDIGYGMSVFSNFLKMNGTFENSAYVFKHKMEDFDPTTFDWKEAKKI